MMIRWLILPLQSIDDDDVDSERKRKEKFHFCPQFFWLCVWMQNEIFVLFVKKTNVCVCVCHKCRHRTLFFIIDDVPYVQSKFVNFFYSQYKLWTRILNSLINRLWSFCIMTNIDSITIDTWNIRFICIIFFLWFEKK